MRWVWPLLSTLLLMAAIIAGRRLAARLWRRPKDNSKRCRQCGYSLEGLDLPRCPECGALYGFTTPMEELGLSETELRASIERKRAAGDKPSKPAEQTK